MRSWAAAWQFLTVLPWSGSDHRPAPEELAGSMVWFPLVGLILGAILALADVILMAVLAPAVVNVLLIILLVVLTGGLHVDGLADTVDGLAGGRTPADRLRIMRDVHIGALGVAGLLLALGLRYAALSVLPGAHRAMLLLCMPLVGRWGMVVSAWRTRYARPEGGLAHAFLARLRPSHVVVATIWLASALIPSMGAIKAAIMGLLIAGVARVISLISSRLVAGMTGDVLGLVNEVTELVFLIAAPAVLALDLTLPAWR